MLLQDLADSREGNEHTAHLVPQSVFGPNVQPVFLQNVVQLLPNSAVGDLVPREGPTEGPLEDPRLPVNKHAIPLNITHIRDERGENWRVNYLNPELCGDGQRRRTVWYRCRRRGVTEGSAAHV